MDNDGKDSIMDRTELKPLVDRIKKARDLMQKSIDEEIQKHGSDMIVAREDLEHWIYDQREDIKLYDRVLEVLCNVNAPGREKRDAVLDEVGRMLERNQSESGRIRREREKAERRLLELEGEAELAEMILTHLASE